MWGLGRSPPPVRYGIPISTNVKAALRVFNDPPQHNVKSEQKLSSAVAFQLPSPPAASSSSRQSAEAFEQRRSPRSHG